MSGLRANRALHITGAAGTHGFAPQPCNMQVQIADQTMTKGASPNIQSAVLHACMPTGHSVMLHHAFVSRCLADFWLRQHTAPCHINTLGVTMQRIHSITRSTECSKTTTWMADAFPVPCNAGQSQTCFTTWALGIIAQHSWCLIPVVTPMPVYRMCLAFMASHVTHAFPFIMSMWQLIDTCSARTNTVHVSWYDFKNMVSDAKLAHTVPTSLVAMTLLCPLGSLNGSTRCWQADHTIGCTTQFQALSLW